MFINLFRELSTEFAGHNFDGFSLLKFSDPAHDVEEALRNPRGLLPSSDLIPTLSFTLSRDCCRSFLAQHPGKPITDRDYYLSKLYQFFLVALLDEGCDAAHFDYAACRLEEILDSLFPKGVEVPDLTGLDWLRIFADYKNKALEGMIAALPSYLPSAQDAATNLSQPSQQPTPQDRESRLKEFVRINTTSFAAVARAANVFKSDMSDWRKNKLPDESIMSRRIESVLSGKTPLKPKPEAI